MAVFTSRPYSGSPFTNKINRYIKRYPGLFFGLPFTLVIVAGSFVLAPIAQTRYDLHDSKHTQMTQEEELNMKKNRRKFDIREEYFRLQSGARAEEMEQWEPVRISRPTGTPEWGVPPEAGASRP